MNITVYSGKKQSLPKRIVEAFSVIPREHKGFTKQIFMLAKSDLKKTYAGAVLGPFWAVMKPLFQLFVYWFAFAIGLRGGKEVNGIPFFVFLMVGFLPWTFMSDTVSRGSKCIRNDKQFVNKISFPVSAIMTYSTLSKLFVQFMLFGLVYIYLLIAGNAPTLYNLQILLYMGLMFLFYLVLLWSLAPMSAFSKDFENLVGTIMSGMFWLSGICYDSYHIDSRFIRIFLYFNPITYFANGFRKSLVYNQWFFEGYGNTFYENLIFFIEFLILILFGVYNYNRLKKRLPDVL